MCISRSLNNVTSNACRHDLCDNVFVGKPDNKTVLRCVVLVLILIDKTDPCSVISLAICRKCNNFQDRLNKRAEIISAKKRN